MAEKRFDDLKKDKERSNHVAELKEKQAAARIHTLSVLAISAVLALAIVILLLAHERWVRRVVNAALLWVLGKEECREA